MDEKDKKLILDFARESIKTWFFQDEPNINEVIHLNEERGLFVTLHKRGNLRGCIGFPYPIMPLYKAVIEAARSAAFHDARFPPLEKSELRDLKIEVSILSVPELIMVNSPKDYFREIIIGVDGLIIKGLFGSGLLLPQVATENNFTVGQFLNCLCQKAGLPFNAWQDSENKIYKFQAEIITE